MITTSRDLAFVAYASGFAKVTGGEPLLTLLAEADAHEGPVYFADENALYFTTLPRLGVDRSPSVQIKRLPRDDPEDISVLVVQANGANGMASDRDGRLIVCEQGSPWEPARISRIDRSTGEREPMVEDWRGLPLNSPNDVAVASDGGIGLPIPRTATSKAFDLSRRSATSCTATTRQRVTRQSSPTGSTSPTGSRSPRRADSVRHRQRRQPGAR